MLYKHGKERLQIEETVFSKRKDDFFRWRDLYHLDIQPDDIISIEYNREEEYGEWYEYTHCQITRLRPETDEEYQQRQEWSARQEEEHKERRYQSYLKMKAEFEPNEVI